MDCESEAYCISELLVHFVCFTCLYLVDKHLNSIIYKSRVFDKGGYLELFW